MSSDAADAGASRISLVEKVARALCAAQGLDWDEQANFTTSGSGADDEREFYYEQARAAIAAMRETTPEIRQAWQAERERLAEKTGVDIGASCFDALNLWRIGHDAALSADARSAANAVSA